MDLDNLQFENDEERRKYLADLARLKRIREEAKARHDNPYNSYREAEDDIFRDLPDDGYEDYDEYEISNEYEDNDEYEGYGNYDDHYEYKEPYEEDVVRKRPSKKKNDVVYKEKVVYRDTSSKKSKEKPKRTDKDKKKKSKWWLWLLLLLLLALLGYTAYNMFLSPQAHGLYTAAVFGVDSRDGNVGKGALSDVNIIAQVNQDTGEIKLVSVYRDTYLQIEPDNYYHKMNESYFKGGPDEALWALSNNLDLDFDDYAAFSWKAVVDGINILGGVDIEVTDKEFAYINGFITETVNATGIGSVQLTGPGMQHLDGVQAVAYARLRLMDTDFQRTERQRKVIAQCFEKAKSADLKTLKGLAEVILAQSNTSVTVKDAMPFIKNIKKYYLSETCGWPFEKVCMDIPSRGNCVIPVSLQSNVCALHSFLYPEKEYTPAEFVIHASNHIVELTGQNNDSTDIVIDQPIDAETSEINVSADNSEQDSAAESVQENPSAPQSSEEGQEQTIAPTETEPVTDESDDAEDESEISAGDETAEITENKEEEEIVNESEPDTSKINETEATGPGSKPVENDAAAGPGITEEVSETPTAPGNLQIIDIE